MLELKYQITTDKEALHVQTFYFKSEVLARAARQERLVSAGIQEELKREAGQAKILE